MSSWISVATYNPTTRELAMDLGGRTYRYFGVEQAVADSLRAAVSIGQFFNANIRNWYKCAESTVG